MITQRDTDLDTTDALWCDNSCGKVADGQRDGRNLCSTCAVEQDGQRLTRGEVYQLTRAQLIWNAR